MHAAKRRWLQVGLGVPEGAALVRDTRTSARPDARDRVLVVGGDLASSLAVPLQSLAGLSRSELTVDTRSGSRTEDWLTSGLLVKDLLSHRPTGVVVATSHLQPEVGLAASQLIAAFGARQVWVSNGDELPGSAPVLFATHGPSARQMASLSAAAWLALG
jgi:hypothetical protein